MSEKFLKSCKCNEGRFSRHRIKKLEGHIAGYFRVSRLGAGAPAVVLQLLRHRPGLYQTVYKTRKPLRNNANTEQPQINGQPS